MDTLDDDAKIRLAERLGKLEGMLTGLQSTLHAQNQQTTQFLVRIEKIEQRQLEMERSVATGGDLRDLAEKVDHLLAADARNEGRTSLGRYAVPLMAQWSAVLVAAMALTGVRLHLFGQPQSQPPAAGDNQQVRP